jgi:hypothetical protein
MDNRLMYNDLILPSTIRVKSFKFLVFFLLRSEEYTLTVCDCSFR